MIESANYVENGSILAEIDGVGLLVPNDITNRHRQQVAEWEAAGNIIPPYIASPIPIPPLPRLTFWLAAAEIGVTKAAIRAHIDAMPEGLVKIQAQAYLDDALVYRRTDPLLIAMAAAEGISEPELDALWAWAAASYS